MNTAQTEALLDAIGLHDRGEDIDMTGVDAQIAEELEAERVNWIAVHTGSQRAAMDDVLD